MENALDPWESTCTGKTWTRSVFIEYLPCVLFVAPWDMAQPVIKGHVHVQINHVNSNGVGLTPIIAVRRTAFIFMGYEYVTLCAEYAVHVCNALAA